MRRGTAIARPRPEQSCRGAGVESRADRNCREVLPPRVKLSRTVNDRHAGTVAEYTAWATWHGDPKTGTRRWLLPQSHDP